MSVRKTVFASPDFSISITAAPKLGSVVKIVDVPGMIAEPKKCCSSVWTAPNFLSQNLAFDDRKVREIAVASCNTRVTFDECDESG
jgi:hypothetical protein